MKKILSLILALAMALALISCGQSAKGGKDDTADASRSVDTSEDIAADRPEVDASEIEEAPEVELDGPPVLTFEDKEGTVAADDGTVVMQYSYQIPTVEVPCDPDVTAAIQAELDKEVEEFLASVDSSAEEAKSIYADPERPEDASYMYHYESEMEFVVTRCDERVVSLKIRSYVYSGGAHGSTGEVGRTYDVMTGRRLTFEDLGDQGFKDLCLEKVTALTKEADTEENMFFDDYQQYLPSIIQDGTSTYAEAYGYDDIEGYVESTFFMDDQGVTFIDGEYVLQPYASGILYFTVPYEELAGVMPETYMPM